VLVTISLLLLIASVSFPTYSQWHSSLRLKAAASDLAQAISLARVRSANGFHNAPHGIYLVSDPADVEQAVIYQGPSYAERVKIFDEVMILNGAIMLETNITDREINFSQSFGRPSQVGSIVLRDDNSRTATITVNAYGVVDY
jgi:Tfp pilus assembly protein FimT